MVEKIYKKIDKITFGVLSPEMVKKMSAVKIVTHELYDREGYPVDGGLMDVRLGVIDPGIKCKTCGAKLKECPGHFGHLELARPVLHIKYIHVIYDFLRHTCKDCGKLLTDKRVEEGDEGAMADALKKLKMKTRSVKKCPYCAAVQEKIKFEKPYSFYEGDRRLTPLDIQARMEKISDDDFSAMGYDPAHAKPEWFIMTNFPVPPVTIRPSITLETGERSEDDLTHKLGDIVRINQRLFENINAGAPEIIVEDLWDLLQYHITTYFDNAVTQIPPARHRSGQALKTLTDRIKSKEGRFRHNLIGKRVNYAARTVISPDSKIELNEVGVPLVVAMELTVPERVTAWNLERLKSFVKNGPSEYPGSNYVLRPDGKKKKITDETQEQLLEELQPGYIVERHLMDGDVSIFNRQPSLHRMSIMAHRVKVLPGKSFRLNPSVCHPYAADFDGDEMNLHIPQTEEARAEAEVLMEVQQQLVTPKNGLNVVGCHEDAVSGNYLLTRDMELSRADAIQLLRSSGINRPERFAKFKDVVGGKEVFSCVLPDDFDFMDQSKNKEPVIIKKGMLMEGIIDKSTIGQEKGGLIRALFAAYNPDLGLKILGQVFRLGTQALLKHGFTTTIGDTDLPNDMYNRARDAIYNAERRVAQLIEQYNDNKLEAMPGITVEATLESKISEVLNKARNKVADILEELQDKDNFTLVMANSGAKGGLLNFAMMASCVGQQSVGGQRIKNGYKDRTLPIFQKGELSPESKGFIKRGYKSGLTPSEYFMHSITGRDSLMDVALRTPKSGYLYRRLSNALQDIKVEYDGTVRDGKEKIVQYKYGEDGLDVSKTEAGKINVARIIKEVLGE
jgi:DNA-directed RNA polymerase subunit A'